MYFLDTNICIYFLNGTVPNNSLIILANNGTLVTRNTNEFSRISQLKLTEW